MDPSGHYPRHCGSGAYHSYPGAYGRDHQQGEEGFQQLLHKNGHEPTAEEIAEELDMPVEKVREIIRVAQEPVSLETPIGEEEDSHLGDFIPDDDAPAPAEAASHTLLKEQLNDVLSTLTEREKKVLCLRFWFGRRTFQNTGRGR